MRKRFRVYTFGINDPDAWLEVNKEIEATLNVVSPRFRLFSVCTCTLERALYNLADNPGADLVLIHNHLGLGDEDLLEAGEAIAKQMSLDDAEPLVRLGPEISGQLRLRLESTLARYVRIANGPIAEVLRKRVAERAQAPA